MNKYVVYLFLLLPGLFSCKTTGGIFGNKIKPLTASELDQAISENRIAFNTFSSKSKIDVSGPGISQSVSAQIDMIRDSLIGISLRVIGVEGARMLITPDSVKIIDRLNQTYIAKDFAFIRQQFGLNISFADFQNLIAGNPVFYDTTSLTTGVAEDKYVLFAQKDVYKNTIWLTPDLLLNRMFIEDLSAPRNVAVTYSEFDKIDGQPFAFIRSILVDAEQDYAANIEFTKVTIDEPVEFSFSINPKYKKLE